MALLARVSGPAAIHIVICDAMGEELKRRYPSVGQTRSLSNVFLVEPCEKPFRLARTHPGGSVTLGYLSKVTREKGAYLALQTLAHLRLSGVDARLRIGGAFESEQDAVAFKSAIADHGLEDNVELLGFLGEEGKASFFQMTDYFLFPSVYKNETQGIVNLEALSWGVPVIAVGQCCIPSDLGTTAGIVVTDADRYAQIARDFIMGPKNPEVDPRGRFCDLHKRSSKEIEALISLTQQGSIG